MYYLSYIPVKKIRKVNAYESFMCVGYMIQSECPDSTTDAKTPSVLESVHPDQWWLLYIMYSSIHFRTYMWAYIYLVIDVYYLL